MATLPLLLYILYISMYVCMLYTEEYLRSGRLRDVCLCLWTRARVCRWVDEYKELWLMVFPTLLPFFSKTSFSNDKFFVVVSFYNIHVCVLLLSFLHIIYKYVLWRNCAAMMDGLRFWRTVNLQKKTCTQAHIHTYIGHIVHSQPYTDSLTHSLIL